MKAILIACASALALSACADGALTPKACANAQSAVAAAQAAIALYPDPDNLPEVLVANLAVAQAALPAFCPAPATVVIPAGAV